MTETRSTPEDGRARSAAGLIPVLLAVLGLAACHSQAAPATCRAEAEEPIDVSVATQGADYPRQFSGTLEAAEPAAGLRPGRLTVRRDDSNAVEVVEFLFPGGALAFPVGNRLDVTVEQVAGFPTFSGIIISDQDGLLLAAASDSAPGRTVLKRGVPGFEIRARQTACPSRDGGTCYEEITNLALELRHGSSTLALMQGESGRIGDFQVTCLVAEEIVYSNQCLDAGRIALSYLIVRSDLRPQ